MKSWYISGVSILAIFIGIFIFASLEVTTISAILMLTLIPVSMWFGWTLHERALYRNEILEQRVADKLRNGDVSLRRRKVTADD